MSNFKFYDRDVALDSTDFVAHISSNVSDKNQFLFEWSKQLKFPDFFGFNWDALHDCLGDLSWINTFKIVLIHDDIPKLAHNDLSIYLNILNDEITDWTKWEDGKIHCMEIYFPIKCKHDIDLLVK